MNNSVIVLFFSLLLTQPLVAEETVDSQEVKKLQELKKNYIEAKESAVNFEVKQRKILGTLYTLNKKIKKMNKKRGRLSDKMLSVKGNVKNLAKSIVEVEKKIKQQRSKLSKRLVALYKIREHGFLPVIFSSNNSKDFDKNLKYLKLISDEDYKLIKAYEDNRKTLVVKKERLTKEVTRLVKTEKRLKKQENLIEKQQKSKGHFLAKLKEKRKTVVKEMESYRLKSQRVAGKINQHIEDILSSTFFEQKGMLPSPTRGQLVRDFGLIQHEKFKYRLSHKGYFYKTKRSEPVTAVLKGAVVFVGEVDGYGETVVIDHGDHYYTVYANLANVLVRKSQKVEAKQKLSTAGAVAEVDKGGLYFEIRHFSEAIDPKPWLSSTSQEIVQRN